MIDNKKYFGKENIFVTGRATTGLYLILKKENIRDKKVLFPANICYAPVFAAIYAGNKPVFVDVADWANISLNKIKESVDTDVSCIVLPHMYGKVVTDIISIKEFCIENNILLVEDCASSFGATLFNKPVGSWGDYSLFSFDHSKIIDVGFGGIVASNRDLSNLEELQKDLPYFNKDIQHSLDFFSKIYRVIRNSPENSLINNIYNSLPAIMSKYFLFKLTDKEINLVLNSLKKIELEKQKRCTLYNSFKEKFKTINEINICEYSDDDIPWRFSFTYEGDRNEFIAFLLQNNVPISDWYPFIGTFFGVKNTKFVNTNKVEKTIYNLPLCLKFDDWGNIIKNYFAFLKK